MSRRWSLRRIFGRRKKVAGDDLTEPDRHHSRGHTAALVANAFVSSDHLSIAAVDSTPPTSQPLRPLPEQPQTTRSASPPPRAAASTELTTPAAASPAAASPAAASPAAIDPASSAKRPQRLWDQAYDALKQDEPALVATYEKILSCQLQNGLGSGVPETQTNEIAQDDPNVRRCQMKRLIESGLDKTAREAKAKERIGIVMDGVLVTKNVVSLAIQAMPQASLVWAGVCVALEVSTLERLSFPR